MFPPFICNHSIKGSGCSISSCLLSSPPLPLLFCLLYSPGLSSHLLLNVPWSVNWLQSISLKKDIFLLSNLTGNIVAMDWPVPLLKNCAVISSSAAFSQLCDFSRGLVLLLIFSFPPLNRARPQSSCPSAVLCTLTTWCEFAEWCKGVTTNEVPAKSAHPVSVFQLELLRPRQKLSWPGLSCIAWAAGAALGRSVSQSGLRTDCLLSDMKVRWGHGASFFHCAASHSNSSWTLQQVALSLSQVTI